MKRLYLLSFLLTSDRAAAQKCFVRGLDDSLRGNPVFKEWAHSWARRMVIQNAIQMIRPRPNLATVRTITDPVTSDSTVLFVNTLPAEIEAVVALPAFERFVFVMSVLEGCSEQECTVLLGCTRNDVVAARERALQLIGNAAQLHKKIVALDASQPKEPRELTPTVKLRAFSSLVATA